MSSTWFYIKNLENFVEFVNEFNLINYSKIAIKKIIFLTNSKKNIFVRLRHILYYSYFFHKNASYASVSAVWIEW